MDVHVDDWVTPTGGPASAFRTNPPAMGSQFPDDCFPLLDTSCSECSAAIEDCVTYVDYAQPDALQSIVQIREELRALVHGPEADGSVGVALDSISV